MTIAYGIALVMNWEKPIWAGFAAAFISLATQGQSLNKGAMRLLGTLVGVAIALLILALFPQDRWLFMLALSLHVGFRSYMMGGPKRQYFWNVSGFVCVIICMEAGLSATGWFELAMLRAQETGLGILVYALVAVLLWPSNSRTGFDAAAAKLGEAQLQRLLGLLMRQGDAAQVQALSTQASQAKVGFDQLLAAAETDSYEAWESRAQWRAYQQQAAQLNETLEGWR